MTERLLDISLEILTVFKTLNIVKETFSWKKMPVTFASLISASFHLNQ